MTNFNKTYNCLNQQVFTDNRYSIVPIRYKDRFDIMKWRNEQMYHLRQKELLTTESQDKYFNTVISNLFKQSKPNQILFSFLKDNICVGYGGLVHINWVDNNAEISFVMNTELEKTDFNLNWNAYLGLIEKIGFYELNLKKISTFAFDLRPHLYTMLEQNGYNHEATLIDHCYYMNKYINVIIHSKIN